MGENTKFTGIRIQAKEGEPFQGFTPPLYEIADIEKIPMSERKAGDMACGVLRSSNEVQYTWHFVRNNLTWVQYSAAAPEIVHPSGGESEVYEKLTTLSGIAIKDIGNVKAKGIYLPSYTNAERDAAPVNTLNGGMGFFNTSVNQIQILGRFINANTVAWTTLSNF